MKKIKAIGIDYSLNSPAICIATGDLSFENCKFYYVSSKKKYIGNFGKNIITTYKQRNNPNRVSYFDDYLYDKKANGVRNKHAYFFQQYINNVQLCNITHHIKHLVVRHTCTKKDSWEDIQKKFI